MSVLEKIFFGNKKLKQFCSIRIPSESIYETVFLTSRNITLDVTVRHAIISQTPFCIAVWLNKEEIVGFANEKLQLLVKRNKTLLSSVSLSQKEIITSYNSSIVLYTIEEVHNYHLNSIKRLLLLLYSFKSKTNNHFERQAYAALYSYPRNIITVSFKEGDYQNIFPMDFQCFLAEANIYLLGLRTSNTTLKKIIETKKLIIADTAFADIDTIYALGAHHKQIPDTTTLPFNVIESEVYSFPVPEFSGSYKEIELIGHYPSGSHEMLIGKVINSVTIKKSVSLLYHIHFFEFIDTDYKEA